MAVLISARLGMRYIKAVINFDPNWQKLSPSFYGPDTNWLFVVIVVVELFL